MITYLIRHPFTTQPDNHSVESNHRLFTSRQSTYTIDNFSVTMPAYVPPHLRNRTTPSTPSTPSTLATPIRSTASSNNGDRSTPSTYSNGSANRTPFSNPRWSSNGNGVGSESGNGQKTGSPWETGHPGKSHFSRRPYQSSPGSSYPKPNPAYNTPTSSRRDNYQNGSSGKRMDKNDSPQPRHGRAYIQHSPAQLHVFGDSFVGPFKLIDGDSVQIKTFKGASAKASIILITLGVRLC